MIQGVPITLPLAKGELEGFKQSSRFLGFTRNEMAYNQIPRAYPAPIASLARAPFANERGICTFSCPFHEVKRGASTASGVCTQVRGNRRHFSNPLP